MKRIRHTVVTVSAALVFTWGNAAAQAARSAKLFLLENPQTEQWCGYKVESRWKGDVDSIGALVVAELVYQDDRLSTISVTEAAESGDWIVRDRYTLDSKGGILKLLRTIRLSSTDRSVEQLYSIQGGKAVLEIDRSRTLSTGRSVPAPEDDTPQVPVILRIQDFPFASIVTGPPPRKWAQPMLCIKTSK